jgi:hypothetical protein
MTDALKLKWKASGKGAGYYIDMYETEDGKQVIIGSEFSADTVRQEIAAQSATIDFKARIEALETALREIASLFERCDDGADQMYYVARAALDKDIEK